MWTIWYTLLIRKEKEIDLWFKDKLAQVDLSSFLFFFVLWFLSNSFTWLLFFRISSSSFFVYPFVKPGVVSWASTIHLDLPPHWVAGTGTSRSRVDARLINFFAPHLAPLSHACAAHHPSRAKENQRWNQLVNPDCIPASPGPHRSPMKIRVGS